MSFGRIILLGFLNNTFDYDHILMRINRAIVRNEGKENGG